MSRKQSKREKAEREFAILREPQTLDDLCDFITDRGTLAEWCRKKDLRYAPTYNWLYDVDVPERLERYTRAMEARQHALSDVVIGGLRDIAAADVRKLYDDKGKLLDIPKLGDDMAGVVSEISEEEDARTGNIKRKVKMESRKGGHELLGRALGLYRDRIEHEGKLTLEELVTGSVESNGSHKGHTRHATPGSSASDSPSGARSPSKT